MTTTTAPTAAGLDADVQVLTEDDISHVVRDCDSDTSLCGLPVPDHQWVDLDDDDDRWCPECVEIEDSGDRAHMAACTFCQLVEAIW